MGRIIIVREWNGVEGRLLRFEDGEESLNSVNCVCGGVLTFSLNAGF